MLLTIALIVMSGRPAPASCQAPAGIKGALPMFFLERIPPAERDTVVMARICVSPPTAGLGSYTITLNYDSTAMRARHVEFNGGGLQVANPDVAGEVRIAGASPTGFGAGTLATIAFRPKRGRILGRIHLMLSEANSPSGSSVLADAKVAGYPASDRTLGVVGSAAAIPAGQVATTPRIDSLKPRSAHLEDEGVLDIIIYGSGFAPTGNSVLFDAAKIDGVSAEQGATVLRFSAPIFLPAHGQVQPRRVTPGRYEIRVRTPAGTSNSAILTLREDN